MVRQIGAMLKDMETAEFSLIISVDDHTVEPPDVWRDRLPRKYREPGPGSCARR